MDSDVKQLTESWGKSGICLDHPWVDISGLPTSIGELEWALRHVPQEKIFVRIPGETPDAGELPRVDLCNPGELEQRLAALEASHGQKSLPESVFDAEFTEAAFSSEVAE